MSYSVEITKPATKSLDSLDRKIERRIREQFKKLALNPHDNRISKQLETAKDKRY